VYFSTYPMPIISNDYDKAIIHSSLMLDDVAPSGAWHANWSFDAV